MTKTRAMRHPSGPVPLREGWTELPPEENGVRRFVRIAGNYSLWIDGGVYLHDVPSDRIGCGAPRVHCTGGRLEVAPPTVIGFTDFGEAMDAAESQVRRDLEKQVEAFGGKVLWATPASPSGAGQEKSHDR